MVHLLSKLETIYIHRGKIILDEMEDVNMVIFLHNSSIDLGYDVNKTTKFVVRLMGCFEIGAFEMSFNRRS